MELVWNPLIIYFSAAHLREADGESSKFSCLLEGRPSSFLDLSINWRWQNKIKLSKKVGLSFFAAICWELWRERNGRIFLNKRTSLTSVLRKSLQSFCDWKELGSAKFQAQHKQLGERLRSLAESPTSQQF